MAANRVRRKTKPYSRSAIVKSVIKSAMARAGIDTQRELAELTGMSESVLSDKLRGKKDIDLPELWLFDIVLVFTDEEFLKMCKCARK